MCTHTNPEEPWIASYGHLIKSHDLKVFVLSAVRVPQTGTENSSPGPAQQGAGAAAETQRRLQDGQRMEQLCSSIV